MPYRAVVCLRRLLSGYRRALQRSAGCCEVGLDLTHGPLSIHDLLLRHLDVLLGRDDWIIRAG